jgi:hypothetical protein
MTDLEKAEYVEAMRGLLGAYLLWGKDTVKSQQDQAIEFDVLSTVKGILSHADKTPDERVEHNISAMTKILNKPDALWTAKRAEFPHPIARIFETAILSNPNGKFSFTVNVSGHDYSTEEEAIKELSSFVSGW